MGEFIKAFDAPLFEDKEHILEDRVSQKDEAGTDESRK